MGSSRRKSSGEASGSDNTDQDSYDSIEYQQLTKSMVSSYNNDILEEEIAFLTGRHEIKKDSKTFSSQDVELGDVGSTVSSYGSIESLSQSKSHTNNPFLDPKVAQHYQNLYDKSQYECRHLFDPHFTWSKQEEKTLLRKLDKRVALLACAMFVGLQIDRGNLSQAVSDNLLTDLGLSTNEYNYGNTIFLTSFLLAELPSQLISKRLGPDRWVPLQILLWSIIAMSQVALIGKKSFYFTRALLGMLEGGFIPDIVLWLSYFYTSKELPIRLSWFWTTLSLTTILTSLLAYFILHLRGLLGWAGWRWLFLIEGFFTFLIGIASSVFMVPSVHETKSKISPNGWFTSKEEKIIINKVLRDDPSKGDMNNRQPITPKLLWKSLMDYDLWPVYIIGLIAYVPANTTEKYLILSLKSLGFSTFSSNLLTIPYSMLHILTLLGITWLSEHLNERSFICLLQPVWTIPLITILNLWPGSMSNAWGTWLIATLILGNPYIHAICVSWVSRNSNTIRTRTISAALYNIFVQTDSIIASNIYREDDKPLYKRGNKYLLYISIAIVPALLLTKLYYLLRNRYKERIWSKMTLQQKHWYLENTTDEGNKRLEFRFSH